MIVSSVFFFTAESTCRPTSEAMAVSLLVDEETELYRCSLPMIVVEGLAPGVVVFFNFE
jgi:hypothetical protein